jgi:hypothetical protein
MASSHALVELTRAMQDGRRLEAARRPAGAAVVIRFRTT